MGLGGGGGRRGEKKRQSHRTIFLDLSETSTGTSGTNDEVKGCAGPITTVRPLFWPLEKSRIHFTVGANRASPVLPPPPPPAPSGIYFVVRLAS